MTKSRILIVEDDPITRFMMSEMCAQLGYAAETARSGARCLEMLAENQSRADVVLMDIRMPGLSGLDTCARLRETIGGRAQALMIIAVTADEFWQDPQHCAAAGFDDVLGKPISIAGLAKILDSAAIQPHLAPKPPRH